MNVNSALSAEKEGFIFTVPHIFTLLLGLFIGKWLKIDKTSHLISCGTAICGGSATLHSVIQSDEKQTLWF
jgi:uncharacterized membrane protein YadS